MIKILIIEDEESLRREISDILTFEGYKTFEAVNGLKGYEKALEEIPDLILCDIMMPEMNGYEVLASIRDNPTLKLTPFIFLTAMAERDNMRSGMELGADDFIVKPFEKDELLRAVRTRIKISEAVKEQSNKAMDELRVNLVHHLPHELRTPLNGIIGFSQILIEQYNSLTKEQIKEFSTTIFNSGMRLYRLIQNYLLFVQLELKKGGASPPVRIQDGTLYIKETSKKIATVYNRIDDIIFDCQETTEVHVGSLEFIKLIEELSDNAFKFSKEGNKVRIYCWNDNSYFYLKIEDEGIGISSTNLKKIGAYMQFDRFFNEQQGMGLGLIISKKITELYNGKFDIESTPVFGTKVTVALPKSNSSLV